MRKPHGTVRAEDDSDGNKVFIESGVGLAAIALSAVQQNGTIYNGPSKCRSSDDVGKLMRRDNIILVEDNYQGLFFPGKILYSGLNTYGIDGGLDYPDSSVMRIEGVRVTSDLKLPFRQTITRGPFTWVIDLN
jgi:hypothetical protein